MAANQSPPSSASTSPCTKWDVFLSFRGIDTRYTFTDHLYHSLDRSGIRTFRDDPEVRSGEIISDALIEAIHDSKTYVVVLSKNYASSAWCLDELVEILRCCELMSRSILPVFYNIEPSVVRHQTGRFNEAFQQHENRYDSDRLDKWRVTLKNVADLSGYPLLKTSSQADVINEIVSRVLYQVNPVTLDVAKYQVGLESRVKDVATLLNDVTTGVIKIGIYGMGGVGKTTLAKAVYNQNYHRYKGSCFLENVREASQTRKGITRLQQKLVNDVLKCKNISINNADQGIELIRARICSTKILVVIDDLNNASSLDFLVGTFAFGSTIIITTRDEDLLDSINIDAKYKVNELDDTESGQLFCQHAFGGENRIPNSLSELSKEILKRAGGIPLALQVCGSALLNKSEEGWRWYIDKLRRDSIVDVEKILLISFHALKLVDPMLQDMFLDIACLFIGQKEKEVVEILETCYTSVNYNIDILKKRCLLSISYEGFVMHDLLLDMGRKIACNDSPCEFEKHSRLWVSKDMHEVLKENKGTEVTEGIIPSDFCLIPRNFILQESFTILKRTRFAAQTFKRMSKLRFLCLENAKLTGSFENTFKNLRWLYWERCPLKCLPSDFYPQKLVCLRLHSSKLRTMWELNTVPQVFENLKILDISMSFDITTTTDFTKLPCLETLILKGCKSLKEVHISIGSLARLVSLNLHRCRNLKNLPDSICNLRALKSLDIGYCSDLEAIPMNLGNIESLTEFNAECLTICKLPHSIGRLNKLIKLNLSCSYKLKTFPDTIGNLRSLKILNIYACWGLEALPIELGNLDSLVDLRAEGLSVSKLPDSIGHIRTLQILRLTGCLNLLSIAELPSSLKWISLDDCKTIKRLPNLGNMKQLKKLLLRDCIGLTEIQGLEELTSVDTLYLRGCNPSLLKSTFTERFFQIYSGFGHRIRIFAPPSVFPDWISPSADWFSQLSNLGSTVSLDLLPNVSHNFLAMILCSKHPGNMLKGEAVYSVKTTTNDLVWSHNIPPIVNPFSHLPMYFLDVSCMEIVPRTIFSITDADDRLEFTADLNFLGNDMAHLTDRENAVLLGIHLLYKPEITIIGECNSTTVNVDEERRHSSKKFKVETLESEKNG